MLIDCHTHRLKLDADVSILNCYPENKLPESNGSHKLSCGIHPWFVEGSEIDILLNKIEKMCLQNKIVAIGECGLDKNRGALILQKSVFIEQIGLSEQYGLPCILHSVKSHHLVLKARKQLAAKQPWLIHGFNGSIEMILQLSKQNIFISLGENLIKYPDRFKRLLNQVNMDFVLLETDDSDISITAIYEQAATLLEIPMGKLEKRIEANFKRIFY